MSSYFASLSRGSLRRGTSATIHISGGIKPHIARHSTPLQRPFLTSEYPPVFSVFRHTLRQPSFSRSFSHTTSQRSTAAALPQASRHSLPRRFLSIIAFAFFFTSVGFVMAAAPAVQAAGEILNPPTDEETLSMYIPENEEAQRIEDFINNHPLTRELRSNPIYSESRPHLKIPASQRSHNLTGGTLMGSGRVVVPPFAWSERGGKSIVSISYLGSDMCGHPGIVHGGFLATMLDEGCARCCFAALPNKIGMTASLTLNYRAPVSAESFVVFRARTTKVEGRKAWVEGQLETLPAPGEKPVVLVEASALFIEPRQAAAMARVYPVS